MAAEQAVGQEPLVEIQRDMLDGVQLRRVGRQRPFKTFAACNHDSWEGMASPLVSGVLWSIIAPLLPVAPPRPRGSRPRVADRAALTGILFVLRAGIQWEMPSLEMGCGWGITCWGRLRDWQEAGV